MKVGVVTFHSANNYGATLQTWALQKVLKDYGLDAGVIHYHPEVIDGLYDPMEGKKGLKRQWKKFSLSLSSPGSLNRYDKFQSFLTKKFNLIGDFRTYEELCSAHLNLDAYITGSDQVWNPVHIGGFNPAYYLDFAEPGAKKISYAASVGSDYIHPKYKEEIRNSLSTYTGISVRESSVQEAVQELTEKPVKIVLDPTMLLVKEDYEEIKVTSKIKEPYILVYMIEKNPEVMSFANNISISLGLPLIQRRQVNGLTNELPPFYTANAGEFIGLIEGAAYVITNSFHGTVFSILYEKPFVSMLHSDTGSRTVDLLTSIGLGSHILYDATDFQDFSMFNIERPKELRRQIEKLKRSSTEFLVSSLGISDRYKKVKCPTKITKEKCYGCYACKEICPVGAIKMKLDKEGFRYPVTDKEKCTNCGMCTKVCIRKHPGTIKYEEQYPKNYTAYHLDSDLRLKSSSGAVYPALARYAIEEKKGVIVGVRYNENMKVISDIAGTLEEAKAFSGSKYVKSELKSIFPKVKKLLKENRFVLYTGLPCECAGLRSYLRKDYENLLVSELVCHAAPSPKVFEHYVEYLNNKYHSKVTNMVFRNKKKGWRIGDANMVITFENGKTIMQRSVEDLYFKAFLEEFTIRPSCTNCQYTFDKRVGDITIGDCWGVDKAAPELFDNKGISMLMVNTGKGDKVWESVREQFTIKENTIQEIFYKNHTKPSEDKRKRTAFFQELDQEPIENLLEKYINN